MARATSVTKVSTAILQAGAGLSAYGYEGVTAVAGSGAVTGMDNIPADPSPATGYCAFLGLRFVITNRGAATQSIALTSCVSGTTSGGTYTAALMLGDLNAFVGPSTSRTIAWNDGAAAYAIPDAFYFRAPLYNNRLRISCIRMKRFA
jgi:hypothetical protein